MAPKTILLTLAALQGAQAWGTLGHATIAYIAQNYLTDTTATWAKGVLSDTSSSYLANIASWADTYRSTTAGAFSAPFHYIDAEDSPPTSCNVDYDRDCGSTGCSVSAIANYTQRVGDGRLSAANTAEALKFLVHFLGDITQPLHDEALETGGNGIIVTFDGYDTDNLHSDWDTYIPEKLVGGHTLADAKEWADTLTTEIKSGAYKSVAVSWVKGDDITDAVGSAMMWATDANALVCKVVMPNGVAALQTGDLYTNGYYESVIGTVELQIAKGGYRLANWLNMIVDANLKRRGEGAQVRPLPDLMGRDLLPPLRPLSRAKMARAAIGYGCGHEH
ncbi:S1/P1 nuclease-domain-containing protein [Pseudomassariella vexata]|uniref:S1/P1 nuclease-domain-containing protein n=1 Tax=Pseudomassariella vexata TaxID=1141098 RepID=A0A1Y2DE01_9PEZI|nr:S1/P1 nuclease-domain-containing protein [Pseudomassariella vexata]ORY56905.1 S1/P1 nuclease-domain-containing protein [Pseudomassariella vexata]